MSARAYEEILKNAVEEVVGEDVVDEVLDKVLDEVVIEARQGGSVLYARPQPV